MKSWQGKRVFLTGHTGFKGGWLTCWLTKLGAEVRGYSDQIPTQPSFFEAVNLAKHCDHQIGDVRDLDRLTSSLSEFKPDIVFHLAAQPLVRLSYREPVATFASNVMGTINLLEATRSSTAGKIVVITTDKVYENRELMRGYREDEILGGHDPYSASKACAEIATKSYALSFMQDRQVTTCRAGNIFGGGDWSEDRLVPDAMRAFSTGKVLEIRNPKAIRPWQHVIDPLRGYLQIAERDATKHFESFNLGPPDEQCVPVGELLAFVTKNWGSGANWKTVEGEKHLKETQILKLDSSLADRELGWKARINLDDATALTVEWYRAFYNNATASELYELTIRQIQKWEALR